MSQFLSKSLFTISTIIKIFNNYKLNILKYRIERILHKTSILHIFGGFFYENMDIIKNFYLKPEVRILPLTVEVSFLQSYSGEIESGEENPWGDL